MQCEALALRQAGDGLQQLLGRVVAGRVLPAWVDAIRVERPSVPAVASGLLAPLRQVIRAMPTSQPANRSASRSVARLR